MAKIKFFHIQCKFQICDNSHFHGAIFKDFLTDYKTLKKQDKEIICVTFQILI